MLPEGFKSHIVFEKLDQFHQALATEDAKEKLGIDSFAFFEASYNYIENKLKVTIPLLVQEAELANLATEIEAGTAQINSFLGNGNTGNLTNATNNFYSALTRIRNLPFPFSKGDFDFSKSIADFSQTVTEKYKTLEELNSKLQDNFIETERDLIAKQNQITEIEKKLAAKEVEIQNVLSTYQTEYTNLKATINTNIESDRKKFSELIEGDRAIFGDTINKDQIKFKKEFEGAVMSSELISTDLISKLNVKLEEANKIVNIIGNVGVTGNYQNIANQNKTNANFWRWIAIFFMVLMSSLLVWSIIELGNADFNLYKSLVRVIAAAVLTYPAIYAARESTKHRNLETKNRNIELELASIGPFIEMLPEDKKQKIKEELVSKYFGNHDSEIVAKDESEDVSIGGLEKILKAILPFIKK
jgi:hypothetical protein